MVIEELYTRLGFQVDPQGIEKGKQLLSSFKSWVGGLAIGVGFTLLAKTGLDAAMSMESLNAQFTVMAGSAERSRELIAEITDFAKQTPFSKLGLADAGKTLMAFGLSSEKVIPTLRMLGDVAGVDQNKLKGLALVFGQIQSTGKLMGQDLLQLITQGFNPLTEISKETGIAVADLKKAMEKGAISADMVTAAFQSATSEGGMYFKNLEAQSKTLQGRISTLKDNVVQALQNMAEAFLPMLKAGTEMLIAFDWTPIVSSIEAVAGALQKLPDMFGTIATWARRLAPLIYVIFGPAINAQIMRYVAALRSAITASGAFAAVQGIVQRAALASGAAMNYQITTIGLLKSAFFSLKTSAVSSFRAIGLAMKTALGPIGIALMAIEGFVEAYNWLKNKTEKEASEKELQFARNLFKDKFLRERKTREQVLDELEGKLEDRKQQVVNLQEQARRGGRVGLEASKQIEKLTPDIRGREKVLDLLKQVYAEQTGVAWRSRTPSMVVDPKLGGDNREFLAAFAGLEKAIKDNEKATKKNTAATDANTQAQRSFDISELSRKAFDAAFNVKLRELTLGTI